MKLTLKSPNLSVSLVLDIASPSPALADDQLLLLDLGGQLCDLDIQMTMDTVHNEIICITNHKKIFNFTNSPAACCLLQLLLFALEQHEVDLLIHQHKELLVKELLDKFTRG